MRAGGSGASGEVLGSDTRAEYSLCLADIRLSLSEAHPHNASYSGPPRELAREGCGVSTNTQPGAQASTTPWEGSPRSPDLVSVPDLPPAALLQWGLHSHPSLRDHGTWGKPPEELSLITFKLFWFHGGTSEVLVKVDSLFSVCVCLPF